MTDVTVREPSEGSAGSRGSHVSEEPPSVVVTSVSGRWMRKKRKVPTRLMTVSEMNTV